MESISLCNGPGGCNCMTHTLKGKADSGGDLCGKCGAEKSDVGGEFAYKWCYYVGSARQEFKAELEALITAATQSAEAKAVGEALFLVFINTSESTSGLEKLLDDIAELYGSHWRPEPPTTPAEG
jgi:hypothetical protein